VAAWFLFWMLDCVLLQKLAVDVGSGDASLTWPRIPALVVLPRFGWLLFPVLLVAIHLSARAGGGALTRVVVALAPTVIAPAVYWRSLEGLVVVMFMSPSTIEPYGLYRAGWSIIFFAPEYLALVLTCASAAVIYALAPRVIPNAVPSPGS
jgi:hypothetical protein